MIHTNFTIDSRFNVKGVAGIVVNGVVLKGTIRINQDMMFGHLEYNRATELAADHENNLK